ncbi:MAG: HEAT repeat domain-containing protein, partial [Chlamydiia bacterium]|nr:HEAT repeat domain-containing protein [Chlamydiia bacterium]
SAIALGCMRDAASVDRLVSYTKRGVPNLEVAASLSLVRLGREDAAPGLEKLAHAGNCYAIFALGEVSGSEDCLARLLAHSDLEIRVHAGLALLQRKDPRALPIAQTVLTDSQLDVAALPCYSPSGALRAWRVLSSAQQNLSSDPYAYELAIQSREQILAGIALLGEEHFLPVAEQLMAQNMNALIPGLIHLLEELNSPAAVELLQRHVHQPGAPLIRNYCKLALFRMGEAPQYRSDLEDWLLRESQHDIISFRPLVPWERHQNDRAFELTPTEKSRLLIECFETIAALQDEPAMRTLQKAMLEGDSLNRYALAGLLLRAST